jgi:hypothetical protein
MAVYDRNTNPFSAQQRTLLEIVDDVLARCWRKGKPSTSDSAIARLFPHCMKQEFHEGKHDTRRFARLIESGKLMFAIVGACGYAGCLAAMHFVLGAFSLCLMAGAWYALYAITEVE